MARIMAIDYGTKRVGLAVTDPFKIIATGLTTIHAKDVINYIKDYCTKNEVEAFVVGEPKNLDNTPAQSAPFVEAFIKNLKKQLPDIPVDRFDERYTSKIASKSMVMAGLKKKDRQRKELVDETSAVLILQSYMDLKKSEDRNR